MTNTSIPTSSNAIPQDPTRLYQEARQGGSRVVTFENVAITSLSALGVLAQMGSRLEYLTEKVKKVVSVFTAVAGYLSGATNLITGAFEGYWLARKVSFHNKMDKSLKEATTAEDKAAAIWKAYSAFLNIDKSSINKQMDAFSKKTPEKQLEDLYKTYDEEVNGWGDYFGNLIYKIKAYAHKKLGREYALKNLIQERHEAVNLDKTAFVNKLSDPSFNEEDKAALIKDKKRELLVKRVERTELAALGKIVSPTFAHELHMNKDNIDLNQEDHQKALISLQNRVTQNYKANIKADVVECVGHIALGVIGLASTVFIKVLALRFVISAISTAVSIRSAYKAINATRRLLGGEVPSTFAEETYELFKAFKKHKIEAISPLGSARVA